MLRQLTSAELTELEAMWNLENGWGDYKQDWRTAQICAVQVNTSMAKGSEPVTMEDFVLQPDVARARQEEIKKSRLHKVREGLRQFVGVKLKRSGKKKNG